MDIGKLKYLDMESLLKWEEETSQSSDIRNYRRTLSILTNEEDKRSGLKIISSFFNEGANTVSQFKALYTRMLQGKAAIIAYCLDDKYVAIRLSHLPSQLTTFLAPAELCKVELAKSDESFLQNTITQVLSDSSTGLIVPPTVHGSTIAEISNRAIENKKKLEEQKQLIAQAEAEMKAKEIALREEMDRKIQALKDEAESQLALLEEKKEDFEKEFFKLEISIGTLRSLLGDNYSITQLRKGKRASLETPIVVFQKLHYLDEDFAKIEVLYNNGNNMFNFDYFDEAISKQDKLFEYFCPSEKCVSVVRISADGVYYSTSAAGGNILDAYAIEQGSNICILLRDGEQLFALWCEDNITLQEDLIASSREIIEIEEGKDYKVKDIKHICRQVISRQTVFNILVGLSLYRTPPILQVEGGFVAGNKNIIYSTADNWLMDSKPELHEVIKRVNLDTIIGDYILPTQSISGYHDYKDNYGNSYSYENRGRGNNLAKDASIPNQVVKVNLVETEENRDWINKQEHFPSLLDYPQNHPELISQLKKKMISSYNPSTKSYSSTVSIEVPCPPYLGEREGEDRYSSQKDQPTTYIARFSISSSYAGSGYVWKEEGLTDGWEMLDSNSKWRMTTQPKLHISKKLLPQEHHIFVSCEKRWSDKNAKANVEIMLDEFLNLTYIGSDLLLYYISTKKTGTINTNFTSAIYTLKKALDFVREREQSTLIILNRVANKPLDSKAIFPLLYQWQEANKVHTMTDFQAKRFLKSAKII